MTLSWGVMAGFIVPLKLSEGLSEPCYDHFQFGNPTPQRHILQRVLWPVVIDPDAGGQIRVYCVDIVGSKSVFSPICCSFR